MKLLNKTDTIYWRSIGKEKYLSPILFQKNRIQQKKELFKDLENKKKILAESIHPTFEVFALDYVSKRRSEWSNEKHANQWLSSLQRFAFPVIGKMKLKDIETKHILKILLEQFRCQSDQQLMN